MSNGWAAPRLQNKRFVARSKAISGIREFMVQHLRVSIGVPEEMDRFLKAFKEIFPKKASATTARG